MLLLCVTGMAQRELPKLNFDHLTIKDGLSHNKVQCLLQDHNGYIWIGTANGLNRYDGYGFKVFNSNGFDISGEGFLGKSITALYEDDDHNLWVGTAKDGVNLKFANSDVFVNSSNDTTFLDLKGSNVSSIYEDREGNMWFSTIGAGVLKYDPNAKESKCFTQANSGLSSDIAFDIVQDYSGVIWVGASGRGINYLGKNDRFELLHSSSSHEGDMNGFRKSLSVEGKYLWVGTEGTGLYQINLIDKSTKRYFSQNENSISSNGIKDIHIDQNHNIYIATDGTGLDVFNKNNNSFSNNNHQNDNNRSVNSNSLTCILQDRAGNIWVGSFNGGLNIYKPNKTWFDVVFPTNSYRDQLKSKSVLSVGEDNTGGVYIGTDGGGLYYLNPRSDGELQKIEMKSSANSISGNAVKFIYQADDEHLWLGVFNEKTCIYNRQSKKMDYLPEARSVWTIDGSSKGEICLGTIGHGLILYDQTENQSITFWTDPNDDSSIASNLIMSAIYDDEDRLWIGTADAGLDLYNPQNRTFTHFTFNLQDTFSLSSDEVRALYQDSKGEIWIGTEDGGLNRWLGEGRFERIGEEQGLIDNSVMGICEDVDGMIWLTTFVGISRYNPMTNEIQNFNFRTSQNLNQFNQMAIMASKNDKLFFGGTNGLHSIYPNRVKEPTTQQSVLFTDFEVSNKSIKVGHHSNGKTILNRPIENDSIIELSYKDNSFTITFSALDFTNLQENLYAYKMDGFDESWMNTKSNQHRVGYTNLDPGEYIFRVKYRDNESSKKIIISPPFWQTNWFKIAITLGTLMLLSGLVVFLIRRRNANYKRLMLKLEKDKLESSLEAKNSKLMFFALQMAHKNEVLSKFKEELKESSAAIGNKASKLINKIDRELKNEDYWEDFNVYFNGVDQDFVQSIQKEYPSLTSNDIRMCSLVRMNLSNKEIASLCNISSRGVEQSKYRLKKRLGLAKNQDLTRFISQYKSRN